MRTPSDQRVADVMDALVATCQTIDGVFTLDGPENYTTDLTDFVAIGVGNESIFVDLRDMPGYGDGYMERVTVVCSAWSWAGDVVFVKKRQRVIEILAAIREVIGADRTLGGVCDKAMIGPQQSWRQDLAGEGSAVSVGFTVVTESLI